MKKFKCKTLKFFVFILLCAFFLASCATSPKAGPPEKDGVPDFSVLPSGGDLYLWADVKQAKPVLEAISFNGLSGKDASQVLDRTNTALAAFYPKPEAEAPNGNESPARRFFLAGWGNYPNMAAGFSMTFNKDWKKEKSQTGNRYWFNKANNLRLALGSRLAFVSDDDPFYTGLSSGSFDMDLVPLDFEEFRKPCVLSGWHNNPSAVMNSIMTGIGIPLNIPVEGLFFGLIRSGEAADAKASGSGSEAKFEPVFNIRTPSTSHALALSGLLSIARSFLGGRGEGPLAIFGLLLSNAPVRDGRDLRLDVPPMSIDEIALLFNFFSVNLREKDLDNADL